MRRSIQRGLVLVVIAVLCVGYARALHAQEQRPTQARLEAYAKAYEAIGKIRDQFQAEAAEARNKKAEAQQALHEKLRQDVAKAIADHGLTEQQYNHITFLISTDSASRRAFDRILGIAPAEDQATTPPATPASGRDRPAEAASPVANPHLGHVMTSFSGTPNADGLLPVATNEARAAAQHAALAARNTSDIAAMKLHAAHVLHALEPAEGARGPGAGFGLKKAALAIATHIELAARADGASRNITTHAVHVATAARNTAARVDDMIALIEQIQAAATPADAAELVRRLNTLAEQLTAGADGNGDGRITWEEGEGGLQHVEQHMQLLMQAEGNR